ncbi:MAG: hypothetical protein ACLVG5_11405 [Clostridium sp.]
MGTICHADACKDYGLVYGNDYGADPLERFGQIGLEPEEILLLYAFDILSYSVAATFLWDHLENCTG